MNTPVQFQATDAVTMLLHEPYEPNERTLPDLGTLSEEERNKLFRRRSLLGEFVEWEHVSNTSLAERAEKVGMSLRMLRYYHTRFRGTVVCS